MPVVPSRDLTRRGFVAAAVAVAAVSDVASLRFTRPAHAAVPATITASKRTLEVNGRSASVLGLLQPDGTQGLVTDVAQPFQLRLVNGLEEPTLIHWHGLSPPYQQDGVPDISGPPIAPGGEAQYAFPLAYPGTFWMHSHQGLQEQALLAAPLIIHSPEDQHADRQEVVLMLHDFAFRSPQEIYAGLRHATAAEAASPMPGMPMGSMPGMDMGQHGGAMAMDLNDVTFDAFLANDRTLSDPAVVRVEPGGRILLRLINGSSASNYMIELGPLQADLVAVDGHAVRPVRGSRFPIAMAQRIDLAVQLPRGQVAWPVLAVLEGERRRTGIVLASAGTRLDKIGDMAPQAAPPLNFKLEAGLRARQALPARKADRVHKVRLTGAMQGYVWSLNDRLYPDTPPLMVQKGERVEIVMQNMTMMSHPMHLHGHVFQVVAINGNRFPGAMRDTVLVPPMGTVTIAFDADNPGKWAFHCHNLYHMEAGMMTTVQYTQI